MEIHGSDPEGDGKMQYRLHILLFFQFHQSRFQRASGIYQIRDPEGCCHFPGEIGKRGWRQASANRFPWWGAADAEKTAVR